MMQACLRRPLTRLLAVLIATCTSVTLAAQVTTKRTQSAPILREDPAQLLRSIPKLGQLRVSRTTGLSLFFSAPLDGRSAWQQAITVTAGTRALSPDYTLSEDGTVVIARFRSLLPRDTIIVVRIDGSRLRDRQGRAVDADGNGVGGGARALSFRTDPVARLEAPTPATITGYVFDNSTPPRPMQDAVIRAYRFPKLENDPPLPVPDAKTDANGLFSYETPSFPGTEVFLVQITKPGFSESLREVEVKANGMWRVEDSFLQPLSPPVFVTRAAGATLVDPALPAVKLVIPPNALKVDSRISVTTLKEGAFLREKLPPFVTEGTFVDITGVFGEETDVPVTLQVPNIYNLPVGTQIPFGKVDHNTLVWSDLRDLSSRGSLGVVKSGTSGTYIEVQFDKFCSICTSYCQQPTKNPLGIDLTGDPAKGLPSCDGPGAASDNSLVHLREGTLQETFTLPGLREFGAWFQLTFGYASNSATGTVTMSGRTDYGSTRPVEATSYKFRVAGSSVEALYDRSRNNQKPIGTLFWNGKDGTGQEQPTGSYEYTFEATSFNANQRVAIPSVFGGAGVRFFSQTYPGLVKFRTNEVSGRVVLVNQRRSPYGAGWSLLQESRLHIGTDGWITLQYAHGDYRLFQPDPTTSNRWVTAPDDPFDLRFEAGRYVRSLNDGTKEIYTSKGLLERVEDRYGNRTIFTYAGGLLRRVASPTGHSYDLIYDGAGKLAEVRDSALRVTKFAVDSNGDLVRVEEAAGPVQRFEYDAAHRLTVHRGPRGDERTEYAWTNGRLVGSRAYDLDDTLLRRRIYQPSALRGEMAEALRNGGGIPSRPIALNESRIDKIIDGVGTEYLRETDSQGRTTFAQDGLGRITRFAYGTTGRQESRTRPDGTSTEYEYNSAGQLAVRREKDARRATYSAMSMQYQGPFGQLSRVTDAEGKQSHYAYDALGRVMSVSDHDMNAVTTRYEDSRFPHLPTRIRQPTGQEFVATYDAHGNLETITSFPDPVNDPTGRTTRMAYDAAGNLTSVTDAENRRVQYRHDALGRVIETIDAANRSTKFEFLEPRCNDCPSYYMSKITLANNSTQTFAHDALGRMTAWTDALGKVSRYTYDAEGRLLTHTNRNDETIVFEYDAVGQQTKRTLPTGEVATYRYDSLSQMIAAANDDCEIAMQYDLLGRLTQIGSCTHFDVGTAPRVPLRHTIDYTYNRVGARLSMKDDWGSAHQVYTYDNLHRLKTLSLPTVGTQRWTYDYDTAGRMTRIMPSPAGVATTIAYDGADQVTKISHATTPKLDYEMVQYDKTGNLLVRRRSEGAAVLTSTFAYDVLNQLRSAMFSVPAGETLVNRTYSYDAAGRLLFDQDNSYTYDDEGRLVQRRRAGSTITDHYTWDAEGQLRRYEQRVDVNSTPTTVLDVRYRYDPLGRRVEKTVNGVATRYVYEATDVLYEIDGKNRIERAFAHGPGFDDPLRVRDNVTNEAFFFHRDRLGSVGGLSDPTGNLVQRYDYDEYGATALRTAAVDHSYGFAARRVDGESGLHYMRARLYDDTTGRFLSQDPLGLLSDVNPYRYVSNNPVNAVDPLGLTQQGPAGRPSSDVSPWGVGWEWLTGTGPRNRYFANGDKFTEQLRRHEHIEDLRSILIRNIQNGTAGPGAAGKHNYYLGGVQGVGKYLKDYSTLATAGNTGNIAVTYLGSYRLTYKIVGMRMGKAQVQFHAYNSSTIESATHPPVVGYTKWWHRNIGQPLNDFFQTGPMSRTRQDFVWTELLDIR